MSTPLDLDGPPGCSADTEGAHGEIVDQMERPTWRTEPGCAELVAEVERLRAEVATLRTERQAILDAGGDFLWAGGAKTLPEAVAGALHALDVALTRSANEYDRSPAAKVRDAVQVCSYTDADLVKRAVENAGSIGGRRLRWAAVALNFGLGSTSASALCRACGLGPDEMVGSDGEGEE